MDKKAIFKTILETTKIGAQFIGVKKIYDSMFGHHFYTTKYLGFLDSDFPQMEREKHTFRSYNKNKLIGYIYHQKSPQNKGIFVFCHGYGGGGHHCYLDIINAVVKQGYYVFAYDATANDESEGNDIRGFTQGILDADKAISYVESLKQFKDLPLYLMGHSWGAYSASNAIDYHPRVKGLIAFSGFNISYSIFEANGEIYAGEASKEFLSYIIDKEERIFGKLAFHTSLESFERTKAKVVIVHSGDDETVPICAGYELYYPKFKDNKRFKFIRFNKRGHTGIYYTPEGYKYHQQIEKAYAKYQKDNKEAIEQEKEKFLKELIDRKKYKNSVDIDLLKECIKFIK